MKQSKTIDEHINSFPEIKKQLQSLRLTIKKAAPEATETIKYGIPTFVLKKNLVYFSGYKTHIGFYPCPTAIKKFKKELSKYETSKGTIKFPLDKPLPLALIKKIVKYRVKENLMKRA